MFRGVHFFVEPSEGTIWLLGLSGSETISQFLSSSNYSENFATVFSMFIDIEYTCNNTYLH